MALNRSLAHAADFGDYGETVCKRLSRRSKKPRFVPGFRGRKKFEMLVGVSVAAATHTLGQPLHARFTR
jgi:hypothetical protein